MQVQDIALYGFNVQLGRNNIVASDYLATFGYFTFLPIPSGYKDDYVSQNVGLLVEQFRTDRIVIPALVTVYAMQVQSREAVLFQLFRYRSLDTSIGIQLDKIGGIVGLKRTNIDDAVYRQDLRFQVWLNSSSGQMETIIQVLQKSTGGTIYISQIYPKSLIIHILKATKVLPGNLRQQIRKVIQGGVAIDIRTNNNSTVFSFKDSPFLSTGGFGCANNSTHLPIPGIGSPFSTRITI